MHIVKLRRHAVAGMQGEDVDFLSVTSKVILGNRAFCVVKTTQLEKWLSDPEAGFPLRVTQVATPELVLLKATSLNYILSLENLKTGEKHLTSLETKPLKSSLAFLEEPQNQVKNSLQNILKNFVIPIRASNRSSNPRWSSDCGDEVAAFISEALGFECRLFQAVDTDKSAKQHFTWYTHLHIINLASVRQLEQESGEHINPELFRYDILIDTNEPFSESSWKKISIGDVEFECLPCERCGYMAIDSTTAQRSHPSIVKTLALNHKNMFGIYAQPLQDTVTVTLSDEIKVME